MATVVTASTKPRENKQGCNLNETLGPNLGTGQVEVLNNKLGTFGS